ncbi:IS3 family transposase [Streptomyces sp. NRRL S-813]|uniref:IS3 family transposase n=1 Tax=Streptomyces sp. NRRL S-813 TaxID=1463919 RepID=UPI000D1B0E40
MADVELATAAYADWYNHRRLHGETGHLPPAEYENNHLPRNHEAPGHNQHLRSLPNPERFKDQRGGPGVPNYLRGPCGG